MLSARGWAEREFGSIDLKDRRLNRRAVLVAGQMAGDPSGSLPKQAGNWKQTKGTYRLFDHEQSTLESMCRSHWERTRSAGSPASGVVLEIQDTTELSYAHHPQTQGTGWINADAEGTPQGQGLFLHSVLSIAPQPDGSGKVLGLSHAQIWAREGEPTGKNGKKRTKRRRSEDRESLRWCRSVEAIGDSPDGARRIFAGDRESDIYDFYEQTQKRKNSGFLVRMKQDRNACLGHGTAETCSLEERKGLRLKQVMEQLPVLGRKTLWIAPRAGQAEREAQLRISAGPVTLWSPQLSKTGRALRCWGVLVREIDPPEGVKPIEWMLLSSERAGDLISAQRLVDYYSLRWLIEEYHQCLKSGCKVEERQLEHADRLEPLIGMLSVVAVRLLQMKNDARLAPEAPAKECVEPAMVRTLSALTGIAEKKFTVRLFVHEVAKRGGFLGRKSDGEPGWKTLWKGWHELTLIHAGYELARERYG